MPFQAEHSTRLAEGNLQFYGSMDDDISKKMLLHALKNGVTLLDTSDTYGDGHNECLIADVLHAWGQGVFLATKFGIMRKPGAYERQL